MLTVILSSALSEAVMNYGLTIINSPMKPLLSGSRSYLTAMWKSLMPSLLKPRARLNALTAGFRIGSLEPASGSSRYCRLINPQKIYSVSEPTELLIPTEKYQSISCSWKLTTLYQERLLISGFIHWIIHCLRSDSGATGNCSMFRMSKIKTFKVCTFNLLGFYSPPLAA